jgi:hypothetical protein
MMFSAASDWPLQSVPGRQPFQQGDVGRGADGERWQQDMPADDPSELDSLKKEQIEVTGT